MMDERVQWVLVSAAVLWAGAHVLSGVLQWIRGPRDHGCGACGGGCASSAPASSLDASRTSAADRQNVVAIGSSPDESFASSQKP
ncbi:MAG: hypothetical protein KDB14_06260 [Planctomycetales bacterium]|nr:hypothetical protein [Planctomycetales bacterium]